MAKATFVHDGDVIDFTPTVDLPAGTIVRKDYWVGIAKHAIAANPGGVLAVTGVYDIPKPAGAGVEFGIGGDVFWSESNSIGYPSQLDPGDVFIGHAVEAARTTLTPCEYGFSMPPIRTARRLRDKWR